MKVIADSSSTRTEWALVDGATIVHHAYTQGLNPYFQTRRELSHCIRLEVPEEFFSHRWEHVHFYGAGCTNIDKKKLVEASLVAQFKTPVTIESDLLGAARGLFVRERGIACILGTGSNSCIYNGNNIERKVSSAGFILGDEGSGSALGKMFVSDCLKNLAPDSLKEEFYQKYSLNPDTIMEAVYTNPFPNRTLSNYSIFLSEHKQEDYVHSLVMTNMESFFKRCLLQFDIDKEIVSFVGAQAMMFTDELKSLAEKYGINIGKIVRESMTGLLQYHSV